jgi:isocitrate lyase
MPQTLTEQLSRDQQISALEKDWATNPRWKGIKRGYSAADVVRLRGSFPIEHTLAAAVQKNCGTSCTTSLTSIAWVR